MHIFTGYIQHHSVILLVLFLMIFAAVTFWELLAPRRALTTSKSTRWTSNFAIALINPLLVHLIFPILAVSMAVKAQEHGWGLLNNFDLPFWLEIAIGIVVLDLVIYLQHVMFHAMPTGFFSTDAIRP